MMQNYHMVNGEHIITITRVMQILQRKWCWIAHPWWLDAWLLPDQQVVLLTVIITILITIIVIVITSTHHHHQEAL